MNSCIKATTGSESRSAADAVGDVNPRSDLAQQLWTLDNAAVIVQTLLNILV